MTGDNTKWQKLRRARNRLFESIIEKDSLFLIEEAYKELCELFPLTCEPPTLTTLIRDANNYIVAVQGGHCLVVSKQSPYAKKFIAEADEAERRNNDAVLMKRMMEKGRNQGL